MGKGKNKQSEDRATKTRTSNGHKSKQHHVRKGRQEEGANRNTADAKFPVKLAMHLRLALPLLGTLTGPRSFSRTFLGAHVLKINKELIEVYQQCTDSESVEKAQADWLEKLEEESKQRKEQSATEDVWMMGNVNRQNESEEEAEEEDEAEDESDAEYDNLGNIIPKKQERYDKLGNLITENEEMEESEEETESDEEVQYDKLGNIIKPNTILSGEALESLHV
ncbi:ribosome biogenesis protein TSR3 [Candidozyma auris]|nr:ribosome biogenesis protein TSR3 [[Candida] auris]